MTLVYAGIAVLTGAPWVFIALVPTLILIDRGVIKREERYLEAKSATSTGATRRARGAGSRERPAVGSRSLRHSRRWKSRRRPEQTRGSDKRKSSRRRSVRAEAEACPYAVI
jgi:hypothetical protein